MKSSVQILTTPTADTPGTTLLLHFDNKRYLIGSLAEGTQRAAVQMGARLLKVSECFITGRTEWSNTGGLIGMILTLADQISTSRQSSKEELDRSIQHKAKKLGIYDDEEKMRELRKEMEGKTKDGVLKFFAPPNLNHTLATARKFVFRKGTPVDVHEIGVDHFQRQDEDEWAPYWADENIKVWAMSISPSTSNIDQRRVSRPTTPRKRTIDEVYDRQPIPSNVVDSDLTQKERDLLTVKAVVSEMFDSSWRLDTLHETPLSEVKLPATIFIRNKETNKIEKYRGPLPNGEKHLPDPDVIVLVRKPWPGALVETLPLTEPAKEAISYVFRNHTQRGQFKPEIAKQLKVEKGRKWAQLAAGHSVENEEGATITSDMVLGPSKEGGGVAVVDLPDPSYIDGLLSRPEWHELKVMAGVGCIIWICGKDVATDRRVHDFMRQFSKLEHIVSSTDYCPNNIALDSSTAATLRLRKVDDKRYGVPVHDSVSEDKSGSVNGKETLALPEKKVHIARRGHIFQLEPKLEVQQDEIVPLLQIAHIENEMAQDVLDEAAIAQAVIQETAQRHAAWIDSLPNNDAEVITLGTGSALPSKYRNVSATLVRVPGWGNILLDCGENTLGQLKRVFPPSELKQVLQDLRLMWISHMHADHHLGTVGVLKAWYEEVHGSQPTTVPDPKNQMDIETLLATDQKRLAFVSEPAMLAWLSEYSAIEDYGFSHLAPLNISPASPHKGFNSNLNWFVPPIQLAAEPDSNAMIQRVKAVTIPPSLLDLAEINAVLVQHCHGARAVSITLPSGFKVSYSGDCRPSKAFEAIGRDSTVVIHEATFDDELAGDAVAKNHSTTSEALGVAQGMRAKACVLTHFSQRYQKIPVLETSSTVMGAHEGSDGQAINLNGSGETDDVDMDDEMSADPDNAMIGTLEDLATTYPDQGTTSNGTPDRNIPRTDPLDDIKYTPMESVSAPEAVKFKLNSDMKVCVAFDYMRVKVGELWECQYFTPALLKLFAEDEKVVEVQAADTKPSQKGNGGGKEGKRKGKATAS